MLSIHPGYVPIPKLHQYLLHAIAPRPIAFVSTIDQNGKPNLAPFSFFNCFGSNPPTLIFSPARSGRTGQTKNTHDNVKEIPECVVNIAHADMLYQMNLAGHMFEKGINEFEKSGLTPLPSVTVKPARVAECYVQFECRVNQVLETGQQGSAGNLIICEVTMIHVNEKVLKEDQSIDPFKMNYIARMGSQYWCRVSAENIFTVPGFKMANEVGIGFDNLPEGIRRSEYLTGNEIAQIAALHELPEPQSLAALYQLDWLKKMMDETADSFELFEKQVNNHVKTEIKNGNLPLAFQLLMLIERERKR